MEQEKANNPIIKQGIVGAVSIALIASVGIYLSNTKNKSDTVEGTVVTEQTPTTTEVVKPAVIALHYKDGAYTAPGTYSSPAGNEKVSVSLTIKDDTVTGATFTGSATHPASKKWQEEFSKGFDQAVVGKKIDELNLTVVNGSSLTPTGFMNALATIKAEAKI